MNTVIGIDLGGTKILIGEITQDGQILSRQSYPSDVTSQRIATERIKECLRDFLQTHPMQGEVKGIGIGLVGRVDRKNGIWIEIHPELSDTIDLAKEIQETFHIPCFLGNDVYCATLSEQVYGIGQKTDDFIYFNIGTGIAARCVVDGKIIEGKHFDAGEVGHMVVDMNSDVACVCGNKGCIEPLASGLGLHNRVMDVIDDYQTCISKPTKGRVGAGELFQGYDQGDQLCIDILDRAFHGVAITLMNLIRVCDPDAIVLGGGIGGNDWFIQHMKPYLNPKTIRFLTYGIQKSMQDPKTVGLKGAALLAIENIR